jgi:hypothetical protein
LSASPAVSFTREGGVLISWLATWEAEVCMA